jgi:hypothetical protein
MKNRNTELTAVLFALAFALAPIVQAGPRPDGGPVRLATDETGRTRPTPRARPTPAPRPDGGSVSLAANEGTSAYSEESSAYSTSPSDDQLQVVTIHSTGKVRRGKIGSFVLTMNRPATGATGATAVTEAMMVGMYVNFKVSGTAVAGVDYLPLVSPAYIGASGYAVILVHTLADARAAASRQAYSVVVTLEPGPGYAVGTASSAKLIIEP